MMLRYVALGDSYTIGTSVAPAERWPDQLVAILVDGDPRLVDGDPRLVDGDPRLDLVANLARNGWTSGDVVHGQLPQLDRLRPDLASLLIGVNDVVRQIPHEVYRANVATILDDLVHRLPARCILAVTTPDYTVTPAGASFGDPASQRAGIARNNAILVTLAAERGIPLVDIFDISSRAAIDRSLVASDGLHPSGAQYALWVGRVAPVVRAMLADG